MTERVRCNASTGSGWRSSLCQNTAKVERDGQHYCAIHDPERRKVKDAARRAQWVRDSAIGAAERHVVAMRNEAADLIERGEPKEIEWRAAQYAIKRARARLAELQDPAHPDTVGHS